VGPNSELERWQRKQRLLSNLTEQLKTKECKSVMSALITSKSRILKKWKIIDTGITDAQNECRDKVKFLESLKRSIDQFYYEATPVSCITTALPSLCTAMRTVESVSRYYARQGYLGLLFTKVTNQIVNICKEFLLEFASTVNNELVFWPAILKEIEDYENFEKLIDTQEMSSLGSSVGSSFCILRLYVILF
jgi:dynein heavy chain